MRIDSIQSNIAMRPLGNFLFKCEFSNTLGDTIVSKDVLNEKLMQKLKYSVLSLNIPRMESQQADNLNYGSFFITFPFFSTEKKEMTMRFYETDQMEIFKIFTYLLAKNRWKASTIFRWEQADLYVTVTIYDQRNLYGYGYRALFSETYALKTIKVEPPDFSRTSDVTLLETTIKFNTCQNRNYDRGAISSIDAAGEFARNDSAADNAFISAEEMGDRIAKQFAQYIEDEKGKDPSVASSTDKFNTDNVSKNKELRDFSEKLGANSLVRTAALNDPNSRAELRQLLKKNGVNVNDYSEVSDALVEMGIFGANGRSNHYCQRGASVLDAIVSGDDKRVLAPSATGSIKAWEEAGFKETQSKKVSSVTELNAWLNDLASKGQISEGDKVVIDYDPNDKENGHTVTALYDKNKGWYASSDAGHFTMSGLNTNHKVDEVHVLRMTDEERKRRASKS